MIEPLQLQGCENVRDMVDNVFARSGFNARRLAEACRRFLGIQLTGAGHLPADPHVARAAATGEPFVIAAPGCEATRHLGRVSDALAASLAGGLGPRRRGGRRLDRVPALVKRKSRDDGCFLFGHSTVDGRA